MDGIRGAAGQLLRALQLSECIRKPLPDPRWLVDGAARHSHLKGRESGQAASLPLTDWKGERRDPPPCTPQISHTFFHLVKNL